MPYPDANTDSYIETVFDNYQANEAIRYDLKFGPGGNFPRWVSSWTGSGSGTFHGALRFGGGDLLPDAPVGFGEFAVGPDGKNHVLYHQRDLYLYKVSEILCCIWIIHISCNLEC